MHFCPSAETSYPISHSRQTISLFSLTLYRAHFWMGLYRQWLTYLLSTNYLVQTQYGFTWQVLLHPFSSFLSPSSHVSLWTTIPSPHMLVQVGWLFYIVHDSPTEQTGLQRLGSVCSPDIVAYRVDEKNVANKIKQNTYVQHITRRCIWLIK